LLGAISFLHERAVIHGDVKPENMLLETSEACTRVKLADFGLGRMCASGNWCHGLCGSEHYMALEVLEGRFNALCDVWSSGCVLYECLRGERLVPGDVVARGHAARHAGTRTTHSPTTTHHTMH
jgi:serine/threonine protein kinase